MYIVATGSFWKDAIQHLDITVQFTDMHICQVTAFAPESGSVNLDQSLTWHFENFEPTWESNIHLWYEIDLFEPNSIFGYPDALATVEPQDIQFMLTMLDFQAFEDLVTDAVGPNPVPGENIGLTMFLRNSLLQAGSVLEEQQAWPDAIALYLWYKETVGDIRSDLRPYSILYLRLAECYKHIGDTARAIAFFEASMDTESMTKERYRRGLRHMFYVEADRQEKAAPFRSEKSNGWKRYFYSKGLNAYCQTNLEALRSSQ